MNINWKVRASNVNFWLTIIPAILLLLQAGAAVFGFQIDLSDLGQKLIDVVNSLFVVLTIVGIVNDPTTKGIKDSTRALGYKEPSDG